MKKAQKENQKQTKTSVSGTNLGVKTKMRFSFNWSSIICSIKLIHKNIYPLINFRIQLNQILNIVLIHLYFFINFL